MPPRPENDAKFEKDVAVRDVERVLEVREREQAREVLVEVRLARVERVLAELDAHLRRRVVHARPVLPALPAMLAAAAAAEPRRAGLLERALRLLLLLLMLRRRIVHIATLVAGWNVRVRERLLLAVLALIEEVLLMARRRRRWAREALVAAVRVGWRGRRGNLRRRVLGSGVLQWRRRPR